MHTHINTDKRMIQEAGHSHSNVQFSRDLFHTNITDRYMTFSPPISPFSTVLPTALMKHVK